MARIDKIVNRLENNKVPIEQKLPLLEEFRQELNRYVSGDFKKFQNTAIYGGLKYYYNFYLRKLSNQPPQSHPS